MMTTSGTVGDVKFTNMTTFPFCVEWFIISGYESNFKSKASLGFWNHFVNLRPKSINIPIYYAKKKPPSGSWLLLPGKQWGQYTDVIIDVVAFQFTILKIVYSTVYLSAHQRKHQSSASLAFVRGIHRWPVNSPHKGPVTRKLFPFDDVIMEKNTSSDFIIVKPGSRLDIKMLSHQINQSSAHWRVKSIKFKFKFLIHHFIWYKWINWLIKSVNAFVW